MKNQILAIFCATTLVMAPYAMENDEYRRLREERIQASLANARAELRTQRTNNFARTQDIPFNLYLEPNSFEIDENICENNDSEKKELSLDEFYNQEYSEKRFGLLAEKLFNKIDPEDYSLIGCLDAHNFCEHLESVLYQTCDTNSQIVKDFLGMKYSQKEDLHTWIISKVEEIEDDKQKSLEREERKEYSDCSGILIEFPKEILRCPNLEEITLISLGLHKTGNVIEIPSGIAKLVHLRKLITSGYRLKSVPTIIRKLPKLVDISFSCADHIHPDWNNPTKVKKIHELLLLKDQSVRTLFYLRQLCDRQGAYLPNELINVITYFSFVVNEHNYVWNDMVYLGSVCIAQAKK